jgi:tetratricopeptide (TPR) repeat protein
MARSSKTKGSRRSPGKPAAQKGNPPGSAGRGVLKLEKRFGKNPSDEEAFVKLWDKYLENESWDAMVTLLEKRIPALQDDREKVRALIKLGSLYDEKLGDARRAVDTFHRVLTLEPKNRRAIWALGMLYHDLEDWEKVIEIYLLRIDLAEGPEEKLALRAQLAQIYEQRLQQEDQALMEYIRAARLAPQNVRILLNMEKLATRTESFRELLAIYEDVVEHIDRIELRIALYLKLARLYTEHLSDDQQADGYYKRALDLSGEDSEKLFSISNIYGEEEEWEELITTYSQLIRLAKSPKVKSRVRREISRLYRYGLKDPVSAFFELVRVARYDPDEKGLVDELVDLGTSCEKHLELAAVLEDVGTRLSDEQQRASLYSRLARLHLDDLHNADSALNAVTRALNLVPAHVPAQLVRFDLLEAGKEYDTLAKALESFLSRPDLEEDVIRAQRRRLACVYEEKLGDRERAVELFREGLKEPIREGAPPPEQRDEILEDLYRKQGTWEDLITLLGNRLAETADTEALVNTHLEIAGVYETKLDQADQAFFELVRAVRLAPENSRILDELFRLARKAGFASELVSVGDDLVIALPDPAAADWHARLGLLMEAEGASEESQDRYRRALDLNATHPIAHQKVRMLLDSRNDYEGIVEIDLRRASRIEERGEKLEMLFEAAEILEDKIGNDGRAADVYDRILGLDPGSIAAQKAIRRLRGEAGKVAVFEDDEEEAATIFSPPRIEEELPTEEEDEVLIYSPPRTDEDSEDTAVEAMAREEDHRAASPAQTAAAQTEYRGPTLVQKPPAPEPEQEEIEEPEEDIGDAPMEEEPTARTRIPDPIESTWRSARADPEDADTWEQLASLIQEKDGSEAAYNALEEGTLLASTDECKARLFRRLSILAKTPEFRMRLARLLEDNNKLDDAESSYRTVLREDPAHGDALDGLYRIYESKDALDRYDAILTRTLKGAKDPQSRRSILLRRAALRANQLHHQREALEDLDQLVSADGGDLEALKLQEEVLEQTGQVELLANTYERHLEHEDSGQERLRLLLAAAGIYETRLDDLDKTIQLYKRAVGEDPNCLSSYESLAAALEKKRDWLTAIDVLREASARTDDPQIFSQMAYRMGKILEEQLLRPEEAEEAYRKAAEARPPSAEALAALKGMARRRGDWVEVIRLGRAQQDCVEDPAEQAGILIDLAHVWRDKLENEEKALECYESAIRLDTDNLEAARVVAEARLKKRRHEEAHELLERLAKRGAEGDLESEELAGIHLKLAQTAEALGKNEQAGQAFEKALDLAPANHQVLTQYGYHLARQGHWERAVDLHLQILDKYRHRLEPNEVADIHCLAAQGQIKLGKPEEAVSQYRQALKANPRHLPALRASVDLSRQLGRFDETVTLLSQLRELSANPATRLKLSTQVGDVLSENLNKPADAADAYGLALEEEPNNIDLLEKLRKVFVHAERYEKAVETLERLAHLVATDRQRARFLRIAGDIERERLDDDDRALEFYLRALRHAPLDKRAHGSAVKILNRMRNWRRMTALYEELLRRLPPPIAGQTDRRLGILAELVELYRYRLGDNRKAIATCEQLLTIDPGDIKVRDDLARLYEKEGRLDDAAAIHRSLIADSPFSVDSYHALRRIYEHQGHNDQTLCMAATLNFLDEAKNEEISLLKEHRHALPIPPGRRISEAQYARLLLHPRAGGLLGEMFSFAADHCRDLFVVDQREYKLKSRDRLNLRDSSSKAAATFRDALGFLALPPPEVYGKGVGIKGILAVNTSPPAILFSEDILQRASVPELRFMVARAVAFTRPENLLAAALSPRQLRSLLDAMVEMAFPGGQVLALNDEVAMLTRKFQQAIPKNKANRLYQLASMYREQAQDLSIRDWLEGIEHTCNRAGFALCGDLEACVQVLKAARVVSPTGSSRSLIRELIFYSISDDYFELRKALKASID